MKKIHLTILLLILSSLLLVGCSEKSDNSTHTANTSSSNVSSTNTLQLESSVESSAIEAAQSCTEDTSSDKNSSTESTQSAAEEIEPVLVEYTDEDKELQEILSELKDPVHDIYFWRVHADYNTEQQLKFVFPQSDRGSNIRTYLLATGNEVKEINNLFKVPSTCAEMKELMLRYFSAQQTEKLMSDIVPGTAAENDNGTYSVIFDDEALAKLTKDGLFRDPLIIEINNKLYSRGIQGINNLVISTETAKITSRTADTIEFRYINKAAYGYIYAPSDDYKYEPYYSEFANNGTLKFERGGWKLDSFGC